MTDDHLMYAQMPVRKLFSRIAFPGAVAAMVWAVCSITDGIFVGQLLGGRALAALNLAWPVIMVLTAVSDMIASGSSVRISMHLGGGDADSARRLFTRSMLWIEALSIAFLVIGLLFSESAMLAIGADPELAAMAADYMKVMAVSAPLLLLFFATDNYLRICGKVRMSMYLNVSAAVMNIALDALFLGILGWGLWSAALATAVSLCISSALSLVPFLRGKEVLRFVRSGPGPGEMRTAMSNGLPTFFTSVSGSLYMIFANGLLLAVSGDMAVSALSIMMYVNSVAGSLFSGMATAVQPAISYNHGAGDGRRGLEMGRTLMGACAVLGIITAIAVFLFSNQTVWVFVNDEPALTTMTVHGLRIFALTFTVCWVATCINQTLISVGLVKPSLIIGVLSQLIVPVAVMSVLSVFGLDGIWWSLVVSSVASAAIAAALMAHALRDGVFADTRGGGTAITAGGD